MKSISRLLLVLAVALALGQSFTAHAQLEQTPTPTPTPEVTPTPTPGPPASYPSALPTPYPVLTAPADIPTTHALPVFNGRTWWVNTGESIQAAIDAASSGDRIELNGEKFIESVVTTKTLLIESAPGRRVLWMDRFGPPDWKNLPVLEVRQAEVVLRGLDLADSSEHVQPSFGDPINIFFPCAPAILATDSFVNLIDIKLIGADGKDGVRGDQVNGPQAAGENGAPAIQCSRTIVHADGRCTFTGGGAGRSTGTAPTWFQMGPYGGQWIMPAPNGNAAPPTDLDQASSLTWVIFTNPPAPPSYPSAVPTPYPTLTAPADIQTTHALPAFNGKTWWVNTNGKIQAAIDAASSGDRIVLNGVSFMEHVCVTTKTLMIESAPGRRVKWTSPYYFWADHGNLPVLSLGYAEVVLRGLELAGSSGPDAGETTGHDGYPGALGIQADNASIELIATWISGGDGGDGVHGDYFFEGMSTSAGGNGESAIQGWKTTIMADRQCSFTGGGAGHSGGTNPFWYSSGGFWIYAAPHGNAAPPTELADGSTLAWVRFTNAPAAPRFETGASREWSLYP